MTDLFQEPDDATPLQPDDRQALRQSWITNRQDLNQAEEANIAKGFAWANGRRRKPDDILTTDFVRTLHKQMLGDAPRLCGRQLAMTISRQFFTNMLRKHCYSPNTTWPRKCASRFARALCPRFKRDATVPIEQPSTVAISS